jgi:hypothetical protein
MKNEVRGWKAEVSGELSMKVIGLFVVFAALAAQNAFAQLPPMRN